MDNPFPSETSPFLVPYPPPAQTDQGIKPFKALDLAPSSEQAGILGSRMQAPQASPFLERTAGKDAGKGPTWSPSPGPGPLPDPLHPIPANSLSQVFAPAAPASASGFPFAAAPALAAKAPAPAAAQPAPSALAAIPSAPAPVAAQPAPIAPISPVAIKSAPAIPAAAALAAIPAPAAPAAASLAAIPAPASSPKAAPMAASVPDTSAALRASATPRSGRASEIIAKTDLAMTDADAPEPIPLIVTSGPSVEGRRISAYLGLISSEIVIPMDVLFRNPAPYGELHRIKVAEDQLQKVKRKACDELDARARALGADGIVGIALQYSQIDAVAFLCAATGTAVKLHLSP